MSTSKRSNSSNEIPDHDIDLSEIPELTNSFFGSAFLNRPGENLVKKSLSISRMPSVSVSYEQYLLIKSPPASGKSRALMFIALDKLHNQGIRQALVVVPEKSIGASFNDEPLSNFGFDYDWTVPPQWNLCNVPGGDDGKVGAVGRFLESDDQVLVCTHATFRFAVDKFGVEAFDNRLIAIDEFHHVSANPDNKLGAHLGELIARDQVHVVALKMKRNSIPSPIHIMSSSTAMSI